MSTAPVPEPSSGHPGPVRDDTELASRFWATAGANVFQAVDLDLLPSRLAATSAAVLGVDGVGLSVANDRFRVPLGASDDEAADAERLQFTIGEGPCLHAMQTQTEIRVNTSDINRRWPAFAGELLRLTSYTSIASLPLRIGGGLPGAMDLYFDRDRGAFDTDLGNAAIVAAQVTLALEATGSATEPSLLQPDVDVPAWLYSPNARNRLRTWIAAGVLMAHFGADAQAALTRIRAWAYATERTIDEVTDAIINNDLRPEQLA